MSSPRPWRWQRQILRAALPDGRRIADELEELFVRRLQSQHLLRVHGWHTRQVIGLMLRALDDLQPREVYVCTGASPTYALWGELMSMAAHKRGAVGAVVDGYSRDTRGILEQNFPTFSHGRYAQDQRPRGKVIDFRCTVRIDEVTIRPGDIIFGDLDGVCVVPREIEEEVIKRSLEKARGERTVYEAIKGGMLAQEAWDKYGIM